MRVLVVEDEIRIAEDIQQALARAGYAVDLSHDGADAWFRGETEEFDAIVLDIGLPQMDGLTVLKRWRRAGIATPVLMLTARGAWMERVEGIDAGADDYLPKPFHREEMVARLGAVLRRTGGHASPVIEAGSVRLDTRRMQVEYAGEPIEVSPMEFRLLRYLVHHKGRVVSQVELEDHLYGSDREPDSNAIEALVKRLRRKLGAEAIATRRGYGYVVEG
jgi:two-component system OmpR family response regulator